MTREPKQTASAHSHQDDASLRLSSERYNKPTSALCLIAMYPISRLSASVSTLLLVILSSGGESVITDRPSAMVYNVSKTREVPALLGRNTGSGRSLQFISCTSSSGSGCTFKIRTKCRSNDGSYKYPTMVQWMTPGTRYCASPVVRYANLTAYAYPKEKGTWVATCESSRSGKLRTLTATLYYGSKKLYEGSASSRSYLPFEFSGWASC